MNLRFGTPRNITEPGLDGTQVSYPFTITQPQVAPYRDKRSEHKISVLISGTLTAIWRFGRRPDPMNNPNLNKTLFAYAVEHIKSVISTGSIPHDFGNVTLHTSNVPNRNPIDPNKVEWLVGCEITLDDPITIPEHPVISEKAKTIPSAFISYSHDSDEHKAWVKDLANQLRSDGVKTILDQSHSKGGNDLTHFMEKSICESGFVLMICTPSYKYKADNRIGGTGYETRIITGEILTKYKDHKYIPVLRKGEWAESLPSFITPTHAIDLRSDPYKEENYYGLLQTLLGIIPDRPPVKRR